MMSDKGGNRTPERKNKKGVSSFSSKVSFTTEKRGDEERQENIQGAKQDLGETSSSRTSQVRKQLFPKDDSKMPDSGENSENKDDDDEEDGSVKLNDNGEDVTFEVEGDSKMPDTGENSGNDDDDDEDDEEEEEKQDDDEDDTGDKDKNKDADADKLTEEFSGLKLTSATDGCLLPNHPWDGKKPVRPKKVKYEVQISKKYPVLKDYATPDGKNVDVKRILSNYPQFLKEVKPPTIQKELAHVLAKPIKTKDEMKRYFKVDLSTPSKLPRTLNIVKNRGTKDSPRERDDKIPILTACSLKKQEIKPDPGDYYSLDCEWMMDMYLPGNTKFWFDIAHDNRCITKVAPGKKSERWMFVPSFSRAEIALLDWPEDDIITEETTIRILVVQPAQYQKYVSCCGVHGFPVISLPQDEIGVGYARFWIQKIASFLNLDFIWVLDDSVMWFSDSKRKTMTTVNKRYLKFGHVFQWIEKLVRKNDKTGKSIAAVSPRRHRQFEPTAPFAYKPPQCAVYLNIKLLSSKGVHYRPELLVLEDIMFAYECWQHKLLVFRANRINVFDKFHWKNTGASSPSVKASIMGNS